MLLNFPPEILGDLSVSLTDHLTTALLVLMTSTSSLLQPVTFKATPDSTTSAPTHSMMVSNHHPPSFRLSHLYISTVSVLTPHWDYQPLFILFLHPGHQRLSLQKSFVNMYLSPEFLPPPHVLLQMFNPRTMQSLYTYISVLLCLSF